MHVSDNELKVLIDVLAERLDDDMDMLSDSNFMDERDSVRMAWAVKDLLEGLRQVQRGRERMREGGRDQNVARGAGARRSEPAGAANTAIGVVQATMGDHGAALKDQQDEPQPLSRGQGGWRGRCRARLFP